MGAIRAQFDYMLMLSIIGSQDVAPQGAFLLVYT